MRSLNQLHIWKIFLLDFHLRCFAYAEGCSRELRRRAFLLVVNCRRDLHLGGVLISLARGLGGDKSNFKNSRIHESRVA